MNERTPPKPPRWRFKNRVYEYDPIREVAKCAKDGITLVGEYAQNRNSRFDEEFILELHRRVLHYRPETAGRYRDKEHVVRMGVVTRQGDKLIQRWIKTEPGGDHIKEKMRRLGNWMYEETELLKERPDDLLGALRLATETQYLLVSPELHPFLDGNGRVARLATNAILMMNTHELMHYGVKILPIPLVRESSSRGTIKAEDWVEDPYISTLDKIHYTKPHERTLNDLEAFFAGKWAENIDEMLSDYCTKFGKKYRKKVPDGDRSLLDKFKKRRDKLLGFVDDHRNGRIEPHYITRLFKPYD